MWTYPRASERRLERETSLVKRELELLKKGIEAHGIIYGEYPGTLSDLSRLEDYTIPGGAADYLYISDSKSYTLRAEIRVRRKRILFTSDSISTISVLDGDLR